MAIPTVFKDDVINKLSTPFPDTGQLDKGARQELAKMVRRGEVIKWRGCWVTGSPLGPYPQKTWYRLA